MATVLLLNLLTVLFLGSVLSPTLFPLFINDLNQISCLIHSCADDTTLHLSTSLQI
ncbi:hypothetical protein E2C01_023662 [Portunus trituberculatus]|uniref:Uncharacterized protein n=1 Tax=Portunus trituberculatus TaxID=210409 RepID=A0A5B7EAF5_PORTR|nr:hypothetical protein [Portunus trituberculatus]